MGSYPRQTCKPREADRRATWSMGAALQFADVPRPLVLRFEYYLLFFWGGGRSEGGQSSTQQRLLFCPMATGGLDGVFVESPFELQQFPATPSLSFASSRLLHAKPDEFSLTGSLYAYSQFDLGGTL